MKQTVLSILIDVNNDTYNDGYAIIGEMGIQYGNGEVNYGKIPHGFKFGRIDINDLFHYVDITTIEYEVYSNVIKILKVSLVQSPSC